MANALSPRGKPRVMRYIIYRVCTPSELYVLGRAETDDDFSVIFLLRKRRVFAERVRSRIGRTTKCTRVRVFYNFFFSPPY